MPKWGLNDLEMCSLSGSVHDPLVGLREEFVLHDADLTSLVSGLGMRFPPTLCELEGCSLLHCAVQRRKSSAGWAEVT